MAEKFKLIVAGGRDFDNYEMLSEYLIKLLKNKKNIEIVSGTADGADALGERFAIENNLGLKSFPAPWHDIKGRRANTIGTRGNGDKFWKGAGMFRNKQMADYSNALVVFWDGMSRGTGGMVVMAKQKGLAVRVKKYKIKTNGGT